MPTPQLVVFDLDGTLIDSSLDLCLAVNAALAQVGRPGLPQPQIAGYIGDGAAALVRRALAAGATPTTPAQRNPEEEALFTVTYDRFIAHYSAHKLDNTRLYPGVMQALREIRARRPQLPMAVLTNKPVRVSREICAGLGVMPFFFQVYGGNSFATKKPDPEGLRTLIAEAGVRPEETVMVGDSGVDVETARRCGARALGCSFGLAPEALAAARPDATVGSALEWPAALGL